MNDTIMKVGRVFFWGALILFVIVAIVAVALQSPVFQQRVLDEVTESVNEGLDGEFRAERLSGSLLADVTLHDVRLTDEDGKEVLTADQVHADYSLVTLLFGHRRLDHLSLKNPVLNVTRRPDGTLNLGQLREETARPERQIDIYRVSVTEGELNYDDQSDPQTETLVVHDLELVGRMPLLSPDSLLVRISAVGFELEADFLPRLLAFYGTELSFERAGDAFTLSLADLAVDQSSELKALAISGQLAPDSPAKKGARAGDDKEEGSSIERFSGHFESLEVTPRLVRAFAPNVPLKSPVTVVATFRGDPDSATLEGRASTRGGGGFDFDGSMSPKEGTYDLSGQAENFDVQAWFDVGVPATFGQGNFRLEGDGDKNTVTFDGSDVRANEARLAQVDGRAVLSGVGADDRRLSYDLTATGSNIRRGEYVAGTLDIDLKGSLVPSADEARWPLEQLVAKGAIGLQDVTAKGLDVGRIDSDIDVSGAFPALTGAIGTDFKRLNIGGQSFDAASVNLDLEKARHFRLDASAAHEVLPQLPLFLRTRGSYTETFNVWQLTMLELGRPEFVWRMSEPNRLRVEDGRLTVDSLVLESGGQSVTIDGTYDLGEGDSIAAIFKELGAAQLRGLLDPERLRDQLPERIREGLPESVEDAVPEELEERVPDDIEDLVPERLRRSIPERLRRK